MFSLKELARRGGGTGPHADGWGVAFYDGPDANIIREKLPAARSELMAAMSGCDIRSQLVIAHIRQANHGVVALRNTHPFRRELGGRVHVFAHNGQAPGIDTDPGFRLPGIRPIGETDSEHAFCSLMSRMAEIWDENGSVPGLAQRVAVVEEFARAFRRLGPANFIYSDGDALFVHGHTRTHPGDGSAVPGLHCAMLRASRRARAGEAFVGSHQRVTLIATEPLHKPELWSPLRAGQLLVIRRGAAIINRVDGEPMPMTAAPSQVQTRSRFAQGPRLVA